MIAEVIVDIPVKQTDKPFDYKIPESFLSLIQPGMRVVVPFGNRKRLGFVIRIKKESELTNLKEIDSMIDHEPVLTNELIELGGWLSKTALCLKITAYQAMLPAAMKASYKKYLRIVHPEELHERWPESLSFLNGYYNKEWGQILKKATEDELIIIQKALQEGWAVLEQAVGDQSTSKRIKSIGTELSKAELEKAYDQLDQRAKKQREALAYFINQDQRHFIPLARFLEETGVGRSSVKSLIDKGLLLEKDVEQFRDPYSHSDIKSTEPLPLTIEQQKVLEPIVRDIEEHQHQVYLCHGVTGSGKTEIYLQAIDKVIKKGKEAIVLVPEIALTPQMVHRFKGRFGSDVAVLHSGLSRGEKYDEWRKINRGEVSVVVGARSAVFASFKNLGIVIIDEEHETSYKQEESPRYHARDVAIFRGRYHSCPVVLGSATPSLESFARAQKGVYQLAPLYSRVNQQPLPEVTMVDMREELRSGNRSMFSKQLFSKLNDRLEKGEQSVLFLNRRGYATFVMCRDCGYVVQCPHCDISLTYHRRQGRLKCHYCGYEEMLPDHCPSCQSEYMRYFGTGTQKVEEALTQLLPEARVIRMDVDTTNKKGAHENLLKAFGDGKADILLGTQMIAKGLDFANVTLVGVLAADSMLHLPDFRASEKTFQLLTQVAGRAGRHRLKGEVVIQSYTPDHYAIVDAGNHDYQSFYQKEMLARRQRQYPPYFYLTLITVSHVDFTKVVDATEKIARYLKQRLSNEAIILGPVAPPIPRIKDRYRYQCMIKYRNEPNLINVLKECQNHFQDIHSKDALKVTIDINPYLLM
ncbi:primosomal protein N' (replication factor Y) [Scopulibacillus daqui]|uniref:Replication restart protein PriA n=1 Tax=Scopulibacillus daqui TaxID=1469162 RepID=A0ABS2PW86_9BACL|nr:primosomal protein N' [Scopulibacillus daqui]MBM7644307.1 primosomal protein N' (replication factor Y) [Scopulibacillus daqui]